MQTFKKTPYREKPGYFYILRFSENRTKIGITNLWSRRLKQHIKKQKGKPVQIYHIAKFEHMWMARMTETCLKRVLQHWIIEGTKEVISDPISIKTVFELFYVVSSTIEKDYADPEKVFCNKHLRSVNQNRLMKLINSRIDKEVLNFPPALNETTDHL
ncbi:MAG: hypothetical protein ABJD58_09300 [Cyclobacteriaceae bacterium]